MVIGKKLVSKLMAYSGMLLVTVMLCQGAGAETIVRGESVEVDSLPTETTQASVEFFLDLTEEDDGSALSVGVFQVRVQLIRAQRRYGR